MTTLSIIVASLLSVALGSLWYSKFFGQMWMSLAGLSATNTADEAKKILIKRYGIQVIFTLFTAMALSHFVRVLEITTLAGAFELSAWIWLGFQIPQLIRPVLWERKPFMLFVLHSSYYLLATLLMCIAIVVIS